LKEFWHFGQYLPEGSKYAKQNIQKMLRSCRSAKFNKVGKEAYKMLEKTGVYVLRALALYM
jgi:hypothetical protein